MDHLWCEGVLALSPNLPHLEGVNILGYYERPGRFPPFWCWRRIDILLSRRDVFPRLERVDICVSVGSRRLEDVEHRCILEYLPKLYSDGGVYFWGEKGGLPSGL